jgi:hypothetical protein
MSRKNNDDQPWENQADPVPAGDEVPDNGTAPEDEPSPDGNSAPGGGEIPPEDSASDSKDQDEEGKPDKKDGPELLTIEEHARNMKIDAPVFAAVIQTERWASGKKVPEAAFKKAVEGFLNAPMGGENPSREEAPKNEEKK